MHDLLEGWAPEQHPDVEALVTEISARLNTQDWPGVSLVDARRAAAGGART